MVIFMLLTYSSDGFVPERKYNYELQAVTVQDVSKYISKAMPQRVWQTLV